MEANGQRIALLLASILESHDIVKLLSKLVGKSMMGDTSLTTAVSRRIYELEGSLEAQAAYGIALFEQGELGEAKPIFREMLDNLQQFPIQ